METKEIDLRTFIIKFIALHLRYWKLFTVLLIIGLIISGFIISRPLKTTYYYYFDFGCGELPANLIEQCALSFQYDSLANQFKPFTISATSDIRKRGQAQVIISSHNPLDINKLALILDDYIKNCGLIKTYQKTALQIKQNLENQLNTIPQYYKQIANLKIPDKGYVYGAVMARELEIKKEINKLKISQVELSAFYSLSKNQSKGKRYVLSIGIIAVLFGLGYVIIFFIENAQDIKNEIKK